MSEDQSVQDLEHEIARLKTELDGARALSGSQAYTAVGLHAAEQQLASIIGSAMDAIITVDEHQRVVLFNMAAEQVFQCSAQEVLGTPLSRFIPERFRASHERHVHEFGCTHATSRRMGNLGLISGVRATGEEFPLEASISHVDVSGSRLFTVILRDISERIAAEEQVQSLQRQHQMLLEAAGEGIYGLDLEGNLTFVNPAGARMLGWTSEELVGNAEHAMFHYAKADGTPYPCDHCPIHRTLADGVVQHINADVFWRKDGKKFPVEYTSTPIWENGRLAGAVVMCQDVTERTVLEARLRKTERLAELGTLASGMAHEIGTPMNVILGRAELLMRKTSEDNTRSSLATIVAQVERITKIMNQLLSFARKRPIDRRPTDLPGLVHSVLDVMQERLKGQGIEVDVIPAPQLPAVHADYDQISQVLLNLIINACHAMPDGGQLTLSLAAQHEMVELTFSDTGCGIPEDTLPRLFDPFFTTKPVGEGTGLGLTVVHGIIQEHEGSITVSSQPGKGAVFTIRLPVASSS